ncbi:MAG: FAD-binding protein, partial [Nitrososphaerales archaeon]
CAAGKGDTVFGRAATSMLPISTPPFYAVAMWPGGPNTQGGPVRDAQARILDTKGNPIPRLYGNGECGSIWGFLYAGSGGDMSELIGFGQISGNNAAMENPWS